MAIRDWEVNVSWPRKPPIEVFIRFGLWDTRFCASRNGHTGEDEAGLSVYPAILNDDLTVELHPDTYIPEAYREELSTRFAFPVTGEIVALGSDEEPVLRRVRVLPYPLSINTRREIIGC